jgi:hypothetical protein
VSNRGHVWGYEVISEPNKLKKEPRQLRGVLVDQTRYRGENLRYIRSRVYNANGELQR